MGCREIFWTLRCCFWNVGHQLMGLWRSCFFHKLWLQSAKILHLIFAWRDDTTSERIKSKKIQRTQLVYNDKYHCDAQAGGTSNLLQLCLFFGRGLQNVHSHDLPPPSHYVRTSMQQTLHFCTPPTPSQSNRVFLTLTEDQTPGWIHSNLNSTTEPPLRWTFVQLQRWYNFTLCTVKENSGSSRQNVGSKQSVF